MASADSSTAGRLARMGMPLITPSQGLAALAAALTSACYLLTAVPFAWGAFLSQPSNRANPAFTDFASTEQNASSLTPLSSSPTSLLPGGNAVGQTLSRDTLVAQIAAMVETVVGQAVGHDEPLMAAGLDSLGTVELRNTLESRLGLQLPATLVFDYPSINALADLLYPKLAVATAVAAVGQQMDIIHQHEAQHTSMPATTLTLVPQQGVGNGSRLVAMTAMVTRSPHDAVVSLGGVDAVGRIPVERWDLDLQLGGGSGGMPSRFGAFLSKVGAFDANMFGVGSAEASLMDPQQRVLLETVAEAQQPASVGRGAVGSCGVFVGVSSSDYQRLTAQQAQSFTGYNATSTFLRYITHVM